MENSLVRWRKGIEYPQMFLLSGQIFCSSSMTPVIAMTSPFSWEAFDGGWALLLDVAYATTSALINSHKKSCASAETFLVSRAGHSQQFPREPDMAAPPSCRVTQYSVFPNTQDAFSLPFILSSLNIHLEISSCCWSVVK